MELSLIPGKNVHAVGYDPSINELQIQFHNGDVYSYASVPGDIYAQLINGNADQVFSSVIKPQRYTMPFTKLGNMPLI